MTDDPVTATDASGRGGTEKPAAGARAGREVRTRPGVVVVTGMSGAGKSTALRVLEDMGFEAVDNVPLSLFAGLVQPDPGFDRRLAIGVDIRTRDFGVAPLLAAMDRLEASAGQETRLLFIDCDDEVLRRRFTETRRRHPLAADRPVGDGIRHERQLLTVLRDRADTVIDTTDYQPADLRKDLEALFAAGRHSGLAVFVTSFAFRYGLPREADLVFDVRFLRNPHYVPELQPQSGLDAPVGAHIEGDANFPRFFTALTGMLAPLLPLYGAEGKSYLTIAIGCTGGRHRSVFVAEKLAAWLADQGYQASRHHRDIHRLG